MLKLYRFTDAKKEYWETWKEGKGERIVHWGELGTRGEFKTVKTKGSDKAKDIVEAEAQAMQEQGFAEIDMDEHVTLLVEYAIDGMGTKADIKKRHDLEDRLNETLGWTGLGHCDGGSIGSGTMEVCCFVVDFETARRVIADDLAGTKFGDYTRIFDEDAE
jgi:hypothetical protein